MPRAIAKTPGLLVDQLTKYIEVCLQDGLYTR